jgi:hypothetical protein
MEVALSNSIEVASHLPSVDALGDSEPGVLSVMAMLQQP